jgi:hypothetical protein
MDIAAARSIGQSLPRCPLPVEITTAEDSAAVKRSSGNGPLNGDRGISWRSQNFKGELGGVIF